MTMQTAAAPHPNQSIILLRRQSVVGAGPELAQLLDSVRAVFHRFGHEQGHATFDAFYDLGARRKRHALAHGRSGERRRSEEHTSELQSPDHLVCRLLLEKKKQ